jgi:hypothetical protein
MRREPHKKALSLLVVRELKSKGTEGTSLCYFSVQENLVQWAFWGCNPGGPNLFLALVVVPLSQTNHATLSGDRHYFSPSHQ